MMYTRCFLMVMVILVSSSFLPSKVFDVPTGANFLPSRSEENEVEVPWGKGILGWVAETGETVNLDVAYEVSYHCESYYTRNKHTTSHKINLITIPLLL